MPESVRDRATTAHEFWFQLAKSKTYYWDAEAVRARAAKSTLARAEAGYVHGGNGQRKAAAGRNDADIVNRPFGQGRNRRTSDFWNESLDARIAFYQAQLAHLEHVREHGGILLDEGGDPLGLHINTSGYKGAHFATFGEKLIAPLILGGTSQRGRCPECGASWVRVTKSPKYEPDILPVGTRQVDNSRGDKTRRLDGKSEQWKQATQITTTGWTPTCQCNAGPPTPCTVLDPFLGSGTTAATARRLGRNWIGIELSKEYCDDHIIPRLSEPLFEWAEQEREAEAVIEQGELF
jgi:hypothetical protein